MGEQVRVELSFSEWAFLGALLASLQDILVEQIEGHNLALPEHLLEVMVQNQDHFSDMLILVHKRLLPLATLGRKVLEAPGIPTSARHDSDLLSLELEQSEFAAVWMAWGAVGLLISQEVNGVELRMPTEVLPDKDTWPTFARDLNLIINKFPVPKNNSVN